MYISPSSCFRKKSFEVKSELKIIYRLQLHLSPFTHIQEKACTYKLFLHSNNFDLKRKLFQTSPIFLNVEKTTTFELKLSFFFFFFKLIKM